MKTQTSINQNRFPRWSGRFNPIRNLTPAQLVSQLEQFCVGEFRLTALTFETIAERDDVLKGVIGKRKKAVARHGWEILKLEDSPEAEQHSAALKFFYNNLRATNAVDEDERGGVSRLVRQMMDSAGMKYAAHEIVWQPRPNGLTAEFRFVPLRYFEHHGKKLRFLNSEGAYEGADLLPGEWMVTVGDGLMVACSVAYIYKKLSLMDWLTYSERNGMPGVKGITDAIPNSEQWNQAKEAVEQFSAEFNALMSAGTDISAIDLTAKGNLPYPPLVERMDRAMAALWRGADLSTISQGQGAGAGVTLQQGEGDILEQDDAEDISETLNEQVDRFVIKYLFGEDVDPLAYIQLKTAKQQDDKRDLDIARGLQAMNLPLSRKWLYDRFKVPQPTDDADIVEPILNGGAPTLNPASNAANESANALKNQQSKFDKGAKILAGESLAKDLLPLRDMLAAVADIEDEEKQRNALTALMANYDSLAGEILKRDNLAAANEEIFGTALAEGAAEGRQSADAKLKAQNPKFKNRAAGGILSAAKNAAKSLKTKMKL